MFHYSKQQQEEIFPQQNSHPVTKVRRDLGGYKLEEEEKLRNTK